MAAHSVSGARGVLLGKQLVTVSPRMMWIIFATGALSFLPLVFLQYVGEEPFYPIVAQEMWANKAFIVTTLYGHNYGRPGLFSWLILLVTGVLGKEHVLIAARLIAMGSTLLIGVTLAWLVRRLFNDRLLAAFAAAVFLSGDVLIYRGWLAYADPLFSLCTFGAMACLWVATQERRRELLLLAAIGLCASFLAKAVTGYVFYGGLGLILLWRHENRRFLFTPSSIAIHLAAVAFPFIWNYGLARDTVFGWMMHDILVQTKNTDVPSTAGYIALLLIYPFRTFWYLLPVSAVALYCVFSRRLPAAALRRNPMAIAVGAIAINVLPYWLFPASSTRYLMPIYPLFALVMAYIVLRSGALMIDLCVRALIVTVGVAYVAAFVGFPLYEHFIRGSYDRAAQAIEARAGPYPIFADDFTSVGLSIVADLNARRPMAPPITMPPPGFASGFVLTWRPEPEVGDVDMTFSLGRNHDGRRTRYLLCRGKACAAPGRPAAPLSF